MAMAVVADENAGWVMKQKEVFERWLRVKLTGHSSVRSGEESIMISDLYEDLRDGRVLYRLLESLSQGSLVSFGKLNKGNMQIQRVANLNIVFEYLAQAGVKTIGIGSTDIADGNKKLTLGLVWCIMQFFFAQELGGVDNNMNAIRQTILQWLRKNTFKHPELIPVEGIADLAALVGDGRVLLAVLEEQDHASNAAKYQPTGDPPKDLMTAVDLAFELFAVERLLPTNSVLTVGDEKCVMPYVILLMEAVGEVQRKRREEAEALEAERQRLERLRLEEEDKLRKEQEEEERVRQEAEEEERLRREAQEKLQREREAVERARREEEDRVRREAEEGERLRREAEEKLEREREAAKRAQQEEEERRRLEELAKKSAAERQAAIDEARRKWEALAMQAKATADKLDALQAELKRLEDGSILPPAVQSALESLDRRQLAEVRRLPRPPHAVKVALQVVWVFVELFVGHPDHEIGAEAPLTPRTHRRVRERALSSTKPSATEKARRRGKSPGRAAASASPPNGFFGTTPPSGGDPLQEASTTHMDGLSKIPSPEWEDIRSMLAAVELTVVLRGVTPEMLLTSEAAPVVSELQILMSRVLATDAHRANKAIGKLWDWCAAQLACAAAIAGQTPVKREIQEVEALLDQQEAAAARAQADLLALEPETF